MGALPFERRWVIRMTEREHTDNIFRELAGLELHRRRLQKKLVETNLALLRIEERVQKLGIAIPWKFRSATKVDRRLRSRNLCLLKG